MPKLNRHRTLGLVATARWSRRNYNCIRQVIAMAMFGRKLGINRSTLGPFYGPAAGHIIGS